MLKILSIIFDFFDPIRYEVLHDRLKCAPEKFSARLALSRVIASVAKQSIPPPVFASVAKQSIFKE